MNSVLQSIKSKLSNIYLRFSHQYQPYSRGWYLHRTFRVFRLSALSYAIYQTGYSAGLIDYAYDSKSMEDKLVKLVLSNNHPLITNKQVEKVGKRIINSTLDYCEQNINYYQSNIEILRQQRSEIIHPLNNKQDENKRKEIINNINEKINELTNKTMHATSKYNEISGKWSFVVVDSPEINAFVSPLCPRKIFVYKGLLDRLQVTDDELSIILAHEISHVLLNHATKTMDIRVITQVVQLLLLGLLDPTGLSTLYIEILVYYFGLYILSSYSRQNESQADHYSLEIARNACFDIKKGIVVMAKLAEASSYSSTTWLSTHPSSEDRFLQLANKAKDYDNHINKNINCRTYQEYFKSFLKSKSSEQESVPFLEIPHRNAKKV